LRHMPEGTLSLAPRPGSLVRLTFQKWSAWLLLAKSQRGEGLDNLLPPGVPRGLGAVFLEKESFRENEQLAKPLGQETVIAPVHDGSTIHVSFLLNGPRGRTCTCNLSGLSGTPLHWATRGWLAEPKLGAKAGAHGRVCTDTVRVLSALSLHWTTWAAGAGPPNWCRVRDLASQARHKMDAPN
jgi:hypothetical protein